MDFDDILISELEEGVEIKELIRPFSMELVANLQQMRQCQVVICTQTYVQQIPELQAEFNSDVIWVDTNTQDQNLKLQIIREEIGKDSIVFVICWDFINNLESLH